MALTRVALRCFAIILILRRGFALTCFVAGINVITASSTDYKLCRMHFPRENIVEHILSALLNPYMYYHQIIKLFLTVNFLEKTSPAFR